MYKSGTIEHVLPEGFLKQIALLICFKQCGVPDPRILNIAIVFKYPSKVCSNRPISHSWLVHFSSAIDHSSSALTFDLALAIVCLEEVRIICSLRLESVFKVQLAVLKRSSLAVS